MEKRFNAKDALSNNLKIRGSVRIVNAGPVIVHGKKQVMQYSVKPMKKKGRNKKNVKWRLVKIKRRVIPLTVKTV
jgi:hypothetical protein